MKKALTLLEILLVVMIVGITASFGMANYSKSRAQIMDREAKTQLRLMYSAQKNRKADGLSYAVCNSSSPCDSALGITLDGSTGWSYCMRASGSGFCGSARHKYNNIWSISNSSDAVSSGNCSTTCL